jgi:formylglycine-generating enzyme required for sulfatase activity
VEPNCSWEMKNLKIEVGQPLNLTGPLMQGVSLEFAWLEAGMFEMGSPDSESGRSSSLEDQFVVTLSSGYWLGRYPVTHAQWSAVMRDDRYRRDDGADLPVANVTWFDAVQFCAQLNDEFQQSIPAGFEVGLPTEAQWEYACRAGSKGRHYGGDDDFDVGRIAWYARNSDGRIHPVGLKEPNAWGLHDMLGNCWEWCLDCLDVYPERPTRDWLGTGNCEFRMLRGGSCRTSPEEGSLRSAERCYMIPSADTALAGIRVALRPVICGEMGTS